MTRRLLIRFHSPLLPPASTHHALQLNQYIISVPPESAKFISDLAVRIYSQFGLEEESPHGIQLALGFDIPQTAVSTTAAQPANGPSSNTAASINSLSFALLPPSEPISLLSDLSTVHVFKRELASTAPQSTPAKQKQSLAQTPSITPSVSTSKKDRKRQRSPVHSPAVALASQATVASSNSSSTSTKKKKKKQKTAEGISSTANPSTSSKSTVASKLARASEAPEELPIVKSKKKTRRGKKKKKSLVHTNTQSLVTVPVAIISDKLPSSLDFSSSSSSASSSSSSSSSESSDSDTEMPDVNRRTAANSSTLPQSAASTSASNLTRLPKGHFKFSAEDDSSEPVPAAAKFTPSKAPSSSVSASNPSVQQQKLTPAQNAAPLFFISSKEHMPREKQKRAAREREYQPSHQRKSSTPNRSEPKTSPAAATTKPMRTEESKPNEPTPASAEFEFRATRDKAAIPFTYALTEESKNNAEAEADDEADAEEDEGIDEAQRVALAMESFGEHFIAPRTLKRLAHRNGNEEPSSAVSTTNTQFEKSPIVNLSDVTLQVNDVVAYRCTELGPEWSPVLSEFRRLRLEGAAHSSERQCLQGRLLDAVTATDDDTELVEIPISDIAEARLVEGPSFTQVLNVHRDEQRAKKKQLKWQARHQVDTNEDTTIAPPPVSPKVILSPKEALAAAVATPPHLRVIDMNRSRVAQGLAPLPLPPRTNSIPAATAAAPSTQQTPTVAQPRVNHQPPRRTTVPTTRYTLMSNVLRALQQKKQQGTEDATDSQMSSSKQSPSGTEKGKGSKLSSNRPVTSIQLSLSNKNATLPQPFIIPPSSYHLPSRTAPVKHASSVASDECPPPFSVGLTPSSPRFVPTETHTSAVSAEPSLSDIDRLIQQKKQQLQEQLNAPAVVL